MERSGAVTVQTGRAAALEARLPSMGLDSETAGAGDSDDS